SLMASEAVQPFAARCLPEVDDLVAACRRQDFAVSRESADAERASSSCQGLEVITAGFFDAQGTIILGCDNRSVTRESSAPVETPPQEPSANASATNFPGENSVLSSRCQSAPVA